MKTQKGRVEEQDGSGAIGTTQPPRERVRVLETPGGTTSRTGTKRIEDQQKQILLGTRAEDGMKKQSRQMDKNGRQKKHTGYIDYALADASSDWATLGTDSPAPLPLTANAALRRQARVPGAFPQAGMDYHASQDFTSLEFGEDVTIGPLSQEEKQEEGLVKALPVILPTETAEPMPLPDLKEKGKEAKKTMDLHIYLPLGLCALLLLIVGVSIAASSAHGNTTQTDKANEQHQSNSSSTTTVEPDGWRWDLPFDVPSSTFSIMQSDPAANTPQHLAYRWMKADPWLSNYSSGRLGQRFAMVALYFATNGRNWSYQGGEEYYPVVVQGDESEEYRRVVNITNTKPWLSYEHSECEWLSAAGPRNGATACNNSQQVLDHLVVVQNNLQGVLIDEIGDMFRSLQVLDLYRNSIGGTIPTSIGSLTNLRKLALHRNYVGGSIPSEFGFLTELRKLQLLESKLTGTLPSELWQLSNLEDMQLSGNKDLTGSLPTNLGSAMPNLTLLQFARCQLSGSLPTSLGLLKNLTAMSLHNNQLTGQLPSQLGVASQLTKFFAPNNLFSGTLPPEWSQSLRFVNLQGNRGITGTVPAEWATMSVLKLEGTSIVGTIPPEVCAMRKLSFDCSSSLCGCACPCLNISGRSI